MEIRKQILINCINKKPCNYGIIKTIPCLTYLLQQECSYLSNLNNGIQSYDEAYKRVAIFKFIEYYSYEELFEILL